ncbi:uncharacterized protein M6B38_149940 [Iris pallida]|uniref:Uncharacterized protein n=1 Tax=Iris pallida TaxID=29817 RepID=A0AAX6F8R3_IRIPA|nr:uncharacterized protein M6B38_149940 [Iris pallida]
METLGRPDKGSDRAVRRLPRGQPEPLLQAQAPRRHEAGRDLRRPLRRRRPAGHAPRRPRPGTAPPPHPRLRRPQRRVLPPVGHQRAHRHAQEEDPRDRGHPRRPPRLRPPLRRGRHRQQVVSRHRVTDHLQMRLLVKSTTVRVVGTSAEHFLSQEAGETIVDFREKVRWALRPPRTGRCCCSSTAAIRSSGTSTTAATSRPTRGWRMNRRWTLWCTSPPAPGSGGCWGSRLGERGPRRLSSWGSRTLVSRSLGSMRGWSRSPTVTLTSPQDWRCSSGTTGCCYYYGSDDRLVLK